MKRSEDMKGWKVAGIAMGALLAVGVLASGRDIFRYIRIYRM